MPTIYENSIYVDFDHRPSREEEFDAWEKAEEFALKNGFEDVEFVEIEKQGDGIYRTIFHAK